MARADVGAFLSEWKKRFREDTDQALADWRQTVEPELIRRWMARKNDHPKSSETDD